MNELKMKKPLYKKIKQAIAQKLSDKQAAWGHTRQDVIAYYKAEGVSADGFYWALLHSITPEIKWYDIQPGLKHDDTTQALRLIAQEIGVAY